MPASSPDPTEEPSDKPIDWPGFERRSLLKILGVGTALTLGSGVTTAHERDEDDGENEQSQLDSYYGFATPDAGEVPEDLDPDHEVGLHTELPEDPQNPSRPPFFHFEPAGLNVQSGDVVQFTLQGPDHTITAYHPGMGFQRRVPEGVPPFSSPVLNVGGAWLYQFDEEGVYDLYCGPHHVLGMNMRIVVGDLAEEDIPDYVDTFEGSQDPPLLAPFSKEFLEHDLNAPSEQNEDCEWTFLTPQEILSAPSLDPSTIQNQGSVPFEAVLGDIDRFPDGLQAPEEDGETAVPTVQVRSHDEYGDILVDSDGMTLYMFAQDPKGMRESNCRDDCADLWLPLSVDGEPTAGEDVQAALDVFEREDGETQVVANGWPVYNYARDEAPGDANGQGSGGVWWILQPDGTPVMPV